MKLKKKICSLNRFIYCYITRHDIIGKGGYYINLKFLMSSLDIPVTWPINKMIFLILNILLAWWKSLFSFNLQVTDTDDNEILALIENDWHRAIRKMSEILGINQSAIIKWLQLGIISKVVCCMNAAWINGDYFVWLNFCFLYAVKEQWNWSIFEANSYM